MISQTLARLVWVHVDERHAEDPALGKSDLLAKISCLNLIAAYAMALKHKLRFEPYTHYDDIRDLVGHLDTYAKAAEHPETHREPSVFKRAGLFLGLPMAESNPRKQIKRSQVPLGNLPLDLLSHVSSYLKSVFDNGTFKLAIYQTQSLTALQTMNDILTGTDRILSTPLPLAYTIAISQITWVYILLLPFQLYHLLGYVTIPASICAAYIILGIALIGREIENPFGDDVNDLPLDAFCEQIQKDIDMIMAQAAPVVEEFVMHDDNKLLYPLSHRGGSCWADQSVEAIRNALAKKPMLHFQSVELEEVLEAKQATVTARYRETAESRAELGEAGVRRG
jgi:putative membrane protein